MKRILCIAFFGLFVFTACASIIKGGHQEVPITSEPSGASIAVYDVRTGDEIARGASPYTVTLKRGSGYFKKGKYRVVLEKDGYKQEEVMLEGQANGWYIAGNILIGGLIGWFIVDPATGAMWTLKPEEVSGELEEVAYLPKTEGLHVVLIPVKDLPSGVQERLHRVN